VPISSYRNPLAIDELSADGSRLREDEHPVFLPGVLALEEPRVGTGLAFASVFANLPKLEHPNVGTPLRLANLPLVELNETTFNLDVCHVLRILGCLGLDYDLLGEHALNDHSEVV
jgi:hypothetical protein